MYLNQQYIVQIVEDKFHKILLRNKSEMEKSMHLIPFFVTKKKNCSGLLEWLK
jgi:hypothetical protein